MWIQQPFHIQSPLNHFSFTFCVTNEAVSVCVYLFLYVYTYSTTSTVHTSVQWQKPTPSYLECFVGLTWMLLGITMVTSCPVRKKKLKCLSYYCKRTTQNTLPSTSVFVAFLKCCTYSLMKSCKKYLFSTVYKNSKPHNWCQPNKTFAWAAFLSLFFPKTLIALHRPGRWIACNILCTAKTITNS